MTHLDLRLHSLVLDLDAEGRPDEAAVRRALEVAFARALAGTTAAPQLPAQLPGELSGLLAGLVASRVARDVRGVVPRW